MDYKNGKIYTIRCHSDPSLVYVGSTASTLTRRMSNHRSHRSLWLQGKKNFITSLEILKYDDCYIELYEHYPCSSKIELHKREGEIIRELQCVNKIVPCRETKESQKECRKKYAEAYKIKSKQYYNTNRDKILENVANYKEQNREKIGIKNQEKVCCDVCGIEVLKMNFPRHTRTPKHQENMKI